MIIRHDQEFIGQYLTDTSNVSSGKAKAVYLPDNEQDVCEIMKKSQKEGVPVTISGGGTGNTAGRVPDGGIIISTEKLNRIYPEDSCNKKALIYAEAGVVIKDLKTESEKRGLFYTYDPTEQTAFLGGTIATNASGARSFKYGSTRSSVDSLKLVLADGEILGLKRGEIKADKNYLVIPSSKKDYKIKLPSYKMPETKNSAGYYIKPCMDAVDLFIGQEGTLAFILEAGISMNTAPEDIISCYIYFEEEELAVQFARYIAVQSFADRSAGGTGINAMSIEYLDKNCVDFLKGEVRGVPAYANACIFFEQDINKKDESALLDAYSKAAEKFGAKIDDSWIAFNDDDRQTLLAVRHKVPEHMGNLARSNGYPKVSTDLAVPEKYFYEMMNDYKAILAGIGMQSFIFGHIGDCHMHVNIIPTDKSEFEEAKRIAFSLVKQAVDYGGTVSAEHGIGKTRKEYLKLMYGEEGINGMRSVKEALDPKMILCRGNVFDI